MHGHVCTGVSFNILQHNTLSFFGSLEPLLLAHLAQGQHDEGPPTAGVHDHGHELGVDGAEVAVPRHLGDADVIVALVGLEALAEDMAEFTGSHYLPGHGDLQRGMEVGSGLGRGTPGRR